ncbi:hypothetical protein MPS_3593 [Mycobacterium pseudoshottsii JCM 15466]|nr:hypothetical protein MPS_3593 [Mycobacterium pseudoshottsii JCM 15466]
MREYVDVGNRHRLLPASYGPKSATNLRNRNLRLRKLPVGSFRRRSHNRRTLP